LNKKCFLLFTGLLAAVLFWKTSQAQKVPELGMVTGSENDSLLFASGFRLLGTTVGSTIAPTLSDTAFTNNLAKIKSLKCRLYMCNVLFPSSLKIAGPEVDDENVIRYLTAVLERAKLAGVKNLVLGSGGARRLPDGYDKEEATKRFVLLAKKMAAAAKPYDVTIILENLNSSETNFLTRLSEAAAVVEGVNHLNFRLNADIYHMLKEEESPEEIRQAGRWIVYVEIAEKNGRTLPGTMGDDFKPYLQALKDISYQGPIIIEGKADNLQTDVPRAFRFLSAQLQEVYQPK
jgi:sugar phosphate isomerase/epimerase